MLVSGYVTSEYESAPCPYCGSDNITAQLGGTYSYDHIHCNDCDADFTFFTKSGGNLTETMATWNDRKDGECPFCGGDMDRDTWWRYMFLDTYCPECRVRVEFQRLKVGKSDKTNARRLEKAIRRRA